MADWKNLSTWLASVGATNWGLVSLFKFNLVEYLAKFAGTSAATVSMVSYVVIGAAGAYLLYDLATSL